MTLATEPTATRPARGLDPLAQAIADVEGVPDVFADAFADPRPAAARELVIICYSGDLEKTWASLILAPPPPQAACRRRSSSRSGDFRPS
jgi:hypothetical protein